MRKESLPASAELETLAASLGDTFIQRRDLYAKQLDDGRYICIRKQLRQGHLLAHLRGDITLGPPRLTRHNSSGATESVHLTRYRASGGNAIWVSGNILRTAAVLFAVHGLLLSFGFGFYPLLIVGWLFLIASGSWMTIHIWS